ncbi:MAG TPA: prolyl oligopeptidase family serine peptidase [Acidimicrobiales bacterium]|nr:prolyl oligopeptidase family serine peptidase [Acidimicrobiales bacterium]
MEKAVSLGQLTPSGDFLYWNEGRPAEAGRQVVVRWAPGDDPVDVVPAPFSARTTVHEYGGGSFCVGPGGLFFSNFTDQRLWRADPDCGPPTPITGDEDARARYADGQLSPDGARLVCVRERHTADGVVNDVVVVPTDGSTPPEVVAAGHDFFAAPRWSADGRLAWLAWDHPDMPWDASRLFVDDEQVAGGPGESVSQPRWSGDGVLHWVSDRTGWWNLYREGQALTPMEAEFTGPDWSFGQATYTFLADGRIVAAWTADGRSHLGVLEPGAPITPLDLPFTSFADVHAYGDGVAAIVASPTQAPAVVTIDPDTGRVEVIRASRPTPVDPGYLSTPQAIDFPTTGGATAHALFYLPANRDCDAPPGDLPPLVVTSHGGPTAAASRSLELRTQFWTSRGIAVVDVDYRGSTGYGRAYRQALDGLWGVVDVDDCLAAARHLADAKLVDGARMVIRGSSASGLTALLALTRGVFAAGASLYGVADLAALATDTHKFEARYCDRLVGPWPVAADVYRTRSPLFHADELSAPLILFQGLDDRVVPPAQSEVLVDALRRAGLPFAYLRFEGEGHGFRRSETIRRVVEAELSFYGQVLGFEPADDIEPVDIERP